MQISLMLVAWLLGASRSAPLIAVDGVTTAVPVAFIVDRETHLPLTHGVHKSALSDM